MNEQKNRTEKKSLFVEKSEFYGKSPNCLRKVIEQKKSSLYKKKVTNGEEKSLNLGEKVTVVHRKRLNVDSNVRGIFVYE